MQIEKLTPAIGAILHEADLTNYDAIYQALMDNLVIFIRGTDITPAAHLAFSEQFGALNEPHPIYPHVDGYPCIMKLANDPSTPPDTNSWHTDLTYKDAQPFASVLIARLCPKLAETRLVVQLRRL